MCSPELEGEGRARQRQFLIWAGSIQWRFTVTWWLIWVSSVFTESDGIGESECFLPICTLISFHKSLPMGCINVNSKPCIAQTQAIPLWPLHLALVTGAKCMAGPSLTLGYSYLIVMKLDGSSGNMQYMNTHTKQAVTIVKPTKFRVIIWYFDNEWLMEFSVSLKVPQK